MKKITPQNLSLKVLYERMTEITEYIRAVHEQLNVLVDQKKPKRKKAKYYNSYEVCQLMNISSSTLYRWRNAQKIKFKQVGKRYFYPCSEVDALL